jgi:hypothetical protein
LALDRIRSIWIPTDESLSDRAKGNQFVRLVAAGKSVSRQALSSDFSGLELQIEPPVVPKTRAHPQVELEDHAAQACSAGKRPFQHMLA